MLSQPVVPWENHAKDRDLLGAMFSHLRWPLAYADIVVTSILKTGLLLRLSVPPSVARPRSGRSTRRPVSGFPEKWMSRWSLGANVRLGGAEPRNSSFVSNAGVFLPAIL
jgi:hypothetical protein